MIVMVGAMARLIENEVNGGFQMVAEPVAGFSGFDGDWLLVGWWPLSPMVNANSDDGQAAPIHGRGGANDIQASDAANSDNTVPSGQAGLGGALE